MHMHFIFYLLHKIISKICQEKMSRQDEQHLFEH